MLTPQQRAKLRSYSNPLKDLVFIGKEGLTDNVCKQVSDNLYAHELIKIKVQRSVSDDIKNIADELSNRCECEVVAIMGNKIIAYKETLKPKFEHLL